MCANTHSQIQSTNTVLRAKLKQLQRKIALIFHSSSNRLSVQVDVLGFFFVFFFGFNRNHILGFYPPFHCSTCMFHFNDNIFLSFCSSSLRLWRDKGSWFSCSGASGAWYPICWIVTVNRVNRTNTLQPNAKATNCRSSKSVTVYMVDNKASLTPTVSLWRLMISTAELVQPEATDSIH